MPARPVKFGGNRRGRSIGVAAVALAVLAGCGDDPSATPDTTTSAADAATTSTADGGSSTTVVGGRLADVDFRSFAFEADAVGSDSSSIEVVDVDFADLDGDGEDEAAIAVRRQGEAARAETNVLVYRAADAGPAYVTAVGWGDRTGGGIHDVSPSNSPDGERLVVQLFEPIDEDCCDLGIVERSFMLSGNRLTESGDPTRWPVVTPGPSGSGPIAVSFLPGSQRASVTGTLVNDPASVTVDALEGQVLSIRSRPLDEGDVSYTVTVTGPGGEVGSVAAGQTVDAGIDLPTSGTFSITVAPDTPVEDASPDGTATATGPAYWVDFVLSD